jgi:hypothetical protein
VVALARRREGVPLAAYAGGAVVGAALIMAVGSPWVDGKAMATVSPAILTAAFAGIAMAGERTPFRLESAAVGLVVAGMVGWGAFLAYQGVWLAPKSQAEELEQIGDRFAGQGPALSTEVSIYGPRHFLRKVDAEGATDLRVRQVALRKGTSEDGQYVDLDEILPSQLDPYNLIIVRRSPAESRPPAAFNLVYVTSHYEVWKRQASPGTLVDDLPLGNTLDAGAEPDCGRVAALAAQVEPNGRLVAARVSSLFTVGMTDEALPPGWTLPTPYSFAPSGTGQLTVPASPSAGKYEMWLGGVVFGGLKLSVDGHVVASERGVLNNDGGLEPLGILNLSGGGTHDFTFDYQGAGLEPGSGEFSYGIGPLTLEPRGAVDSLVTIPPSQYRTLCGRRWDWIEAYG